MTKDKTKQRCSQMEIILFSHQDMGMSGGGGTSSSLTAELLRKRGHSVRFITSFHALKKEIAIKRPDIVLHHNIHDLTVVGIYCLLKHIPLAVTINGQLLCAKGTHLVGRGFGIAHKVCGLFCFMRCGWKGHYKMQFPISKRIILLLSAPYRWVRMQARKAILQRVAVICIGKTLANVLRCNGITHSRVYVCPQPIPQVFFEEHKTRRKRQFLFAGGLDTTKGSMVLLEAFSRLQDNVELFITGRIYPICRKEDFPWLNDPRIKMLGEVSQEEMLQLYRASYACVFPSLLLEPFGRVWAEALACGTPVLGIRGRGGPDDYLDENSALLVEPTVEALREGMERLLNDKVLYKKLIKSATARARTLFHESRVGERLEEIYKEILSFRSE